MDDVFLGFGIDPDFELSIEFTQKIVLHMGTKA